MKAPHSPAYFIAAAIADRGYGWIHASPEKVADPPDKVEASFDTVNAVSELTRLLR